MTPRAPLRSRIARLLTLVLLALWSPTGCRQGGRERASGPLAHEAYVWQRDWTPTVGDSVHSHGGAFRQLTYLAGEIRWTKGRGHREGASVDFGSLRALPNPPGIALRVATCPGPFDEAASTTQFLLRTAREVVAEARAAGVSPTEFQLDFDCATHRLDGYRRWLELLRRELSPLPVRFTALPAWLTSRRFAELARASDGFVLQVHSLERPASAEAPFQLCPPDAARAAVERASRLGIPFRVALPTYSYLVAFGTNGAFLGASAEGSMPARPKGTRFRELAADARELADLVAAWTRDRPAELTGITWYRLPVATDRINWRWVTLDAVMRGVVPTARLEPESRTNLNGTLDLVVVNRGTDTFHGPISVHARWNASLNRLVGTDAVHGFRLQQDAAGLLRMENSSCRLPPGDAVVIGWLRLDSLAPVSLELQPHPGSPLAIATSDP